MKIYQVDAFTNKIFTGNPAGVCILSHETDDKWMQLVAREMNLPETAFLLRQDDGSFILRWFTPLKEIDLCGHATLASAHVLFENHVLNIYEEAKFHTKSGLLTATKNGEFIELNFPIQPDEEVLPPEGLLEALQVMPKYIGKNRRDYIIEVETEDVVRNAAPNFELLKKVATGGVILTSLSSGTDYDFVSRFFIPAVGINEDPVTGSSHCCLGPYWKRKLNKDSFSAYQASERGGSLRVRVDNDRVILGGQAVTVFCADLMG